MNKLTVFYDGACPRCRRDRANFERWAPQAPVQWLDITDRDQELKALGLEPSRALRELHVRDQQGRLHIELDAYMLLFRYVWWLRPLGAIIGLPGIRPLVSRWYRWWVDRRLRRQGRG
ncbi:DUF393 domain-containing protein [Gallaecimonas sp. GXIMD4217]|uniref:thiol-disulfide oxidoreductase DCC family protein n=1 Tax=Gallaecimonas sp. GXIMD4217 TaxID=3131927 RepID=UPI00311B1A2A